MRDLFNFDNLFKLFDDEFNRKNSPFKKIDSILGENYKKTTREIEIPGGTCVVISYSLKPTSNDEINDLKSKLNVAIENQEFEIAAEIRDQLKELEKTKTKVDDLNLEMETAIKNQVFERAAEIRDQLKQLKK
jgi:protein-arginine kinase activator protein McsA